MNWPCTETNGFPADSMQSTPFVLTFRGAEKNVQYTQSSIQWVWYQCIKSSTDHNQNKQ